jgi:uncharacterized membrane protein YccC
MSEGDFSIITFTIHSIIFVLLMLGIFLNNNLLYSNTYVNIVYIILGTLIVHGGFLASKKALNLFFIFIFSHIF